MASFMNPAKIARFPAKGTDPKSVNARASHVWLLFVLEDLVSYCTRSGLDIAARALGKALAEMEDCVLDASVAAPAGGDQREARPQFAGGFSNVTPLNVAGRRQT